MNVRELLADRQDQFTAAEKLVMAARESGKDLAGADLEQYQKHIKKLKEIDARLSLSHSRSAFDLRMPGEPSTAVESNYPRVPVNLAAALGLAPENGNGPVITTDSNGRPAAIFSKGHSVEAFVRQRVVEPEGVSLGGIVRAMALGKSTPEIRAALAEGADASGGVMVPTILMSKVIDALRAKSVVFQAGATTVMLDTGKATSIPRITGDAAASWRAENGDVALSEPTFDAVSFTPKSLATIVVVSDEVLEDAMGLESALIRSISAAFAGEMDRVSLLGTGVAPQPKGLTKYTLGSYSMGTNGAALANYDPFVEALAVLQTANANPPTACIIPPRTNKAMSLLKDSTNQPLQRPESLRDLPFLVTSRLPINETQGGSNAASRAVMGYFPDLYIGIRHDLRIQLLREKYADKLQRAFLCDLRMDVAVAHEPDFCQIVGIL